MEISNEGRMAEAKDYHEKQERKKRSYKKKKDVKYILSDNGQKVLKLTITPDGNKYREFMGPYHTHKELLEGN